MDYPISSDGQSLTSVCLLIIFGSVALWLLISIVVSGMARRGEEKIRRMEAQEKLSARIR